MNKYRYKINYDDLKNILDNNAPHYPECKTKELMGILSDKFNLKKYYKGPESNKQLQAIYNIYSQSYAKDIISKFLLIIDPHNQFFDYHDNIITYMKEKKSDDFLYKYMKYLNNKNKYKITNNRGTVFCNSTEIYSQEFYYHLYKYVIKKNLINIDNFLDYGCGDGRVTQIFGEKLKLEKKYIFGVDLEQDEYQWNRRNLKFNFQTIKEDKPLPFKSNSFSLILCNMVLHHIPNLNFVLQELRRILKKDGILIIREHDLFTYGDYMLTDIEHFKFDFVYKNISLKNTIKQLAITNYYNYLEWDYILLQHGFKWIWAKEISKSFIFTIMPTRSFYAIYQKS